MGLLEYIRRELIVGWRVSERMGDVDMVLARYGDSWALEKLTAMMEEEALRYRRETRGSSESLNK
ncbi:MAG: hypothetical protein HYS81_05105 [Candidatus Aenigmatarchaeota archaeon]|nr:MAG: hypothetical protein HYS81_05105 [Candidatus Aenigmarchaeota archaeon]